MSDLNLNVNDNSFVSLTQQTNETDTQNSITQQLPNQPKDSVKTAEQPEGNVNPAAYTANTSRPVLEKPTEGVQPKPGNTSKKGDAKTTHQPGDVATRDLEGEHAAGTLSAGETTTSEMTQQTDQPIIDPQEKKQQNQEGDGNSGGGDSGGQGDSQKGQSEALTDQTLNDLLAQLSNLEQSGDLEPMSSDQLSKLLNSFSKTDEGVAATANASSKSAQVDVPYPEFTIEGDTITGPNGTWTIPAAQSPPTSPNAVYANSYHELKATADVLQKTIINIPESPEKLSYSNFLKVLVKALTEFQEFLYVMNNVDSQSIREKSKAQLETALHKLEEQRKKQEEEQRKAREAGQKGGVLGIFQKVFNVVAIIVSVVLVVAFPPAGPLAMLATGFMVASVTDMIMKQTGGKGLFEKAFEVLAQLSSGLLDAMGIHGAANEIVTLVSKIVLVILTCAVVVAANPMMFLFGGVSNVISFLQDSKIVNEFVAKCGGDEKAQMIASIVVTSVIMLTTLVTSIAMMFIPGGQGAILGQIGSAVTNVTRVVATAIMNVLQTTLRVTEKVAETVTNVIMQTLKLVLNPGFWMTVTMVGAEAANTVNKVKMADLLADLARLRGQMTKMVEQADALIMILKKIIQKLLESLSDTGAFIAQTSQILQKNFQGMSESLNNLYSA
ncbi:MAG: hypothetical protein ACSNEK_02355 [Parachlamydiaceae bacterium]